MGFRHDMKDKGPQARAIVRQRDRADELLEKKPEKVIEKMKIECVPSPRLGDYEGVFFKRDEEVLFELRVSGTAIVNGPCELKDIDIHKWLCNTGKKFATEVEKNETFTILAADVTRQTLMTDWTNLRRD